MLCLRRTMFKAKPTYAAVVKEAVPPPPPERVRASRNVGEFLLHVKRFRPVLAQVRQFRWKPVAPLQAWRLQMRVVHTDLFYRMFMSSKARIQLLESLNHEVRFAAYRRNTFCKWCLGYVTIKGWRRHMRHSAAGRLHSNDLKRCRDGLLA